MATTEKEKKKSPLDKLMDGEIDRDQYIAELYPQPVPEPEPEKFDPDKRTFEECLEKVKQEEAEATKVDKTKKVDDEEEAAKSEKKSKAA